MRVDGGLRWLWGWRGLVQREGQAHSPTKSGRDSAVLEGWCGNPSGSRPNYFGRQHLTFDKGGKDMVLSEGGWGFERVVGMERLVGVKQSLR